MDYGGAGLCCLRIHQALLEQGIESKVLVKNKISNTSELYKYGSPIKEKAERLPSKFLRYFGIEFTERNKLLLLQNKYHTAYTLPVSHIDVTKSKLIDWADIIHLHWVNNYVDFPSFFRKISKPIVWTLHDEGLFYGIAHHRKSILEDNPLEIKYRKIKRIAIQRSNDLTIVFLSKMMYDKFHDEEIISGKRKTIINNSVNTKVFKLLNKGNMRRKYGISQNKIIFAFMAYDISDPNKGLSVLSDALCELDPNKFEILAIGNNKQNREYPLVNSIGNVSNQNYLCEILSAADFYAMPSYQEAFPQSPMEAMACGLPVVAFPVSGTAELINEKNGVVCDDLTKESLKNGISKLLSRNYNPDKIRQDMINRFSPETIADQYIDLYKKILSGT